VTAAPVQAVQCRSCGGSVSHEAGAASPRCLFCGRDALTATEIAGVEPPQGYLPFVVPADGAKDAFRTWARRRFWAPGSIRNARVQLSPLFLPAWTFAGDLETHWAALVRAGTRSGKRPVTGQERARLHGVMVPASQTLSRAELRALSPFACGAPLPLGPRDRPPGPFEVGTLTRAVAEARGVDALRDHHGARIQGQIGASRLHTSCITHALEGRSLLLPVWIGAYLHGERSYRVVINAQTGATVGDAPISWAKVLGAVGAACAVGLLLLAVAATS
jgi:hypothetical protein